MWSKTKKAIESNLCEALQGRLRFHCATYRKTGHGWYGRVWIELDGEQLTHFSDCDSCGLRIRMKSKDVRVIWPDAAPSQKIDELPSGAGQIVNQVLDVYYFDRPDFFSAAREYLSEPIERSRSSTNEIARSMALVDRRFGKRRLREIDVESLHPLERLFYLVRLAAENMPLPADFAQPAHPVMRVPFPEQPKLQT